MKIYVAGPFTTKEDGKFHNNPKKLAENLRKAREIGIKLVKIGHYPYVPHTHIGACGEDISYDELMAINLTFLRGWADALLFLGPSRGANIELLEAGKMGLTIFTSIDQIPKK